jgi:hypothetical protein
VAFSVVEVDELFVGLVIADGDVEIAVAVEVGKGGGVGAIGCFTEGFGGELAFGIVAKNEVVEGPVAAFGEDDIKVAVAIDIPEADTGGGLALGFQEEQAIELADFGAECREEGEHREKEGE